MAVKTAVQTHKVRFADPVDARNFVRAIRKRGWEARRRGNEVYVVIGTRASLDLMVRQWATAIRRRKGELRYAVF